MIKLTSLKILSLPALLLVGGVASAEDSYSRHIYNDSQGTWYIDPGISAEIQPCIKSATVLGRWCEIPPKTPKQPEIHIIYHHDDNSGNWGQVTIMDQKSKRNVFKIHESFNYVPFFDSDPEFGGTKRVIFNTPGNLDIAIASWAKDWG